MAGSRPPEPRMAPVREEWVIGRFKESRAMACRCYANIKPFHCHADAKRRVYRGARVRTNMGGRGAGVILEPEQLKRLTATISTNSIFSRQMDTLIDLSTTTRGFELSHKDLVGVSVIFSVVRDSV